MAPKRKAIVEQPVTTRVTRSKTRVAVVSSNPESQKGVKKTAISSDPKPEKRVKKTKTPISSDPETPKSKRVKKTPVSSDPEPLKSGSKVVVVEHCTQCKQFKIRAVKVKEELESGVPGLKVRVNPEKPRRGCFEIRVDGEKFVSLLDMKRPFGPMKALDMDKVISDIIEKIK
ncbi:unnamed protein product [Withania somnifera]